MRGEKQASDFWNKKHPLPTAARIGIGQDEVGREGVCYIFLLDLAHALLLLLLLRVKVAIWRGPNIFVPVD